MRVAICVGTFHRTELLRELLSSLSKLQFHRNRKPTIEVIVVDNDPAGSAEQICSHASADLPIRYVVEPRRGIANVRNRAVQEAQSVDFIAFIDDDEIASAEWLDELLWAQKSFDLDVVTGPIRSRFVSQVPEWIRQNRCFNRPEFTSGTLLQKCPTSNVLISAAVFKAVPGFDERFQLTGGEDSHFFLRAHNAGFHIGWSQQAVVYETVLQNRANLRWILHRAFQSGNSWVLSEKLLKRGMTFRLARFCIAVAHVVRGLLLSAGSVFLSKSAAVKHLYEAFLGAGMFAGLVGQHYQAYEAKHSTATQY